MKRIIEVRDQNHIYYGGRHFGYLFTTIAIKFGIVYQEKPIKYRITISERGKFSFRKAKKGGKAVLLFCEDGKIMRSGFNYICAKQFKSLFFNPDSRKRYDITVKRVK